MDTAVMSLAETAIRTIAAAELGLLLLLLAKPALRSMVYRTGTLLFLCVSGYLLAPVALHYEAPGVVSFTLILMATSVPMVFWYFASYIFHDQFSAPQLALPLAASTLALSVIAFRFGPADTLDWLDWLAQAAKMAWVAAALMAVVRDWRTDLVAPRRRFRLVVVLVAGLYITLIMIAELFIEGDAPAWLELINVVALLAAITALAMHFLAVDPVNVFARIDSPPAAPSSAESPLARQLQATMTRERAYAADDLSLASLAGRLQTQPQQLRQVINGELGYRNFNTFINTYRVQEVAARLSDEQYRNTPFLTLALDAGFRSLAPFNRSFKAQFGITPTEYRATRAKN